MDAAEQTAARPAAKTDAAAALASLRSADAVRRRCGMVRDWLAAGRSPHFTLDEGKLATVADYVAEITRDNYPRVAIPPHSRWRHFSAGGIERWDGILDRLAGVADIERARVAVDLATVSVLLDAGAGESWRYREPETNEVFARSEGLAVASLDMFVAGAFSSDPNRPLRADAAGLKRMDGAAIARGFQVTPDNPLVGVDGRAALLRRLGQALDAHPDVFGSAGRPSHLVDHLATLSRDGGVPAPVVLRALLESLSSIWPSGLMIAGNNVGDAGLHPAIQTGDATDRIVPFHKLSQWLTYSLIEPLAMAGLTVTDLEGLTALAEYRNGGLLIDLGLIRPRRPIDAPQSIASELVV
jgi:hypothetical protein